MAEQRFEVGEIAIIHGLVHKPQHNGMECTIVALPRPTEWVNEEGRLTSAGHYRIHRNGYYEVTQIRPENLRKKRPPQSREPVSTWDDVIVWRPKETSHVH